jgi:mRNA interferase MazF
MPSPDGGSFAGSLGIGDVVFALFPGHDPAGHEQEGYRPAVVVGLPERLGAPRFGVLLCVPMATDKGQAWAERAPGLYPRYPAGTGGLRSPSICLLDQTRSLGVERVSRYRGTLSDEDYEPIRGGLGRMLGFVEEAGAETESPQEGGDDERHER